MNVYFCSKCHDLYVYTMCAFKSAFIYGFSYFNRTKKIELVRNRYMLYLNFIYLSTAI